MTHRGPFQPLPFCDSVLATGDIADGGQGSRLLTVAFPGALQSWLGTGTTGPPAPSAARGAGSCLPTVRAGKRCQLWGEASSWFSVVSYRTTTTEPVQGGEWRKAEKHPCVHQALPPATFPPSSEGQILSVAPALESLLPIKV